MERPGDRRHRTARDARSGRLLLRSNGRGYDLRCRRTRATQVLGSTQNLLGFGPVGEARESSLGIARTLAGEAQDAGGGRRTGRIVLPPRGSRPRSPEGWRGQTGLPRRLLSLQPGGEEMDANRLAAAICGGRTDAGHRVGTIALCRDRGRRRSECNSGGGAQRRSSRLSRRYPGLRHGNRHLDNQRPLRRRLGRKTLAAGNHQHHLVDGRRRHVALRGSHW